MITRPQGENAPHAWNGNDPIFKYVDAVDAHFIESGSLKFGTLRGYASLEGPRQDKLENTCDLTLDGISGPPTSTHITALKSLGIHMTPNAAETINIFDNRSRVYGYNHYCLCTSYRGDLTDEEGRPQAVFQVEDIRSWMNLLVRENPVLNPIDSRSVMYGSREVDALLNPDSGPNYWIKPVAFEHEFEVRFIARNIVANDAAPIFTKPNPLVAGYMRRIR
ncbi:hypothetical protein [Sphingomonas hankookensis]|uniref:hypothetical protein n=1 Tax=Sphingomonas hankookensis TaxID=563996 RepID=UPI003D301D0B